MNPVEAAKAILEANELGEEGVYPDIKNKAKKSPKGSTSPKATNGAGTSATNGAGSAAGEEGEDNADENESSVDMGVSDAGSGEDQGSEASLAKGVKKKQKSDSGMTEDDDIEFEALLDEDDDTDDDSDDEDKKDSVKEHMTALFSDEDELSEDFKLKAETIFEAAIKEKRNALEIEYDDKLEESVNILRESLADKIDDYLSYVVEEWYNENKIAVEQGLRAEISENFIEGLKGLFEDNYIEIPDEKFDILEEANGKIDELTQKLNEQIENNIALKSEVNKSSCSLIFEEVSEELTDTEIDKLRSLSEGMEYETQEQYKNKLEILKENYFNRSVLVEDRDPIENANGSAEGNTSSPMSKYTEVLDRMNSGK
jgi:hypothetical protein